MITNDCVQCQSKDRPVYWAEDYGVRNSSGRQRQQRQTFANSFVPVNRTFRSPRCGLMLLCISALSHRPVLPAPGKLTMNICQNSLLFYSQAKDRFNG